MLIFQTHRMRQKMRREMSSKSLLRRSAEAKVKSSLHYACLSRAQRKKRKINRVLTFGWQKSGAEAHFTFFLFIYSNLSFVNRIERRSRFSTAHKRAHWIWLPNRSTFPPAPGYWISRFPCMNLFIDSFDNLNTFKSVYKWGEKILSCINFVLKTVKNTFFCVEDQVSVCPAHQMRLLRHYSHY